MHQYISLCYVLLYYYSLKRAIPSLPVDSMTHCCRLFPNICDCCLLKPNLIYSVRVFSFSAFCINFRFCARNPLYSFVWHIFYVSIPIFLFGLLMRLLSGCFCWNCVFSRNICQIYRLCWLLNMQLIWILPPFWLTYYYALQFKVRQQQLFHTFRPNVRCKNLCAIDFSTNYYTNNGSRQLRYLNSEPVLVWHKRSVSLLSTFKFSTT